MAETPYSPSLQENPFLLGRHGESNGNAGDKAQGRGEDIPGQPNGLTDIGKEQVRSAVPALAAAGVDVRYVSSSALTRAKESADHFVLHSDLPKPVHRGPVPGLEEMSQKGWEGVHTRDRVKELKDEAIAQMAEALLAAGLDPSLINYVPWVTRFGRGERPLGTAVRGVAAIEHHRVEPGEIVFAHGMLNRYMDALATATTTEQRRNLMRQLAGGTLAGSIAVLEALRSLGVPDFSTTDKSQNRQANAGATEYTVNPETGLWIPGRRIEPPSPLDSQPYVERHRTPEGIWVLTNRQTP